MTEEQTITETARGRVRRLLIEPAQELGMRFRKGTSIEEQRRRIEQICDGVAYLTDEALAALVDWLLAHGDGTDRSFWPPLIGIISTAEAYQPRPLEEVPGVASWFGSIEGPRALADGCLVAEFLWWQKYKRPPLSKMDRQRIVSRAEGLGREVELTQDKLARGVEPGADAREKLRWYRELEARAKALVQAGIAKRAEREDAA